MHPLKHLSAALLTCTLTFAAAQQAPRVYTDADYAQAEKFMPYNTNPLVMHAVENPTWLADGRFWYRDTGAKGNTFMLVDPAKSAKAPAFDQAKLASAMNALALSKKTISPDHLPITNFELKDADKTVLTTLAGKRISCDLAGDGVCKELDPKEAGAPKTGRRGKAMGGVDVSPDGKKAAFIRDWNLWLRDLPTGKETQLTTDGIPNYGYATDNAGWSHSDNPILVWSPDSKHIATFQQDQRKTGELYLTNVTNGHPTLTTLKYPLVGDKDVTMIERVVINLEGKDSDKSKLVRLKMAPDQHRSTLCDDISCRGGSGWDDVQWSSDSKNLAFVSTSRDHRQEWMRIANPATGEIREVMGETAPKFFESGNDKVNWHYLAATNELLWFSERDGWGHLYLYDTNTGKLKTQITHGNWNVTQVLVVDEKARVIYFRGVGKDPNEDPYFQKYYRVDFTGDNLALLTPERGDHTVTPSPDNHYFVDTWSTPTDPQVTVVRDFTGKIAVSVAHEDITRLKATGWIPPVQIMVKARDNDTNIYGLLFRPTNFTTDGHYPIINHVYPGPQTGSCGSRSFSAAHGDMQSLAELGFIVVCIDGMGTPYRSKAFHEFYAHDLGDDTIPDQIAGMKDLSTRYPWIDMDKIGIYGHSGGGNATASAMFHFPDFFKVGIAESGNHDNRNYEDDWAEKWAGLEIKNPDGTSNYDSQANQNWAKNLKGHLLLAHGTMDDNVPPTNTLLVVDALIKANKDFDLLMIPNVHHGYAEASQYMTRRRWDYFIRYLAGATPPHEYKMKDYAAVQAAMSGNGPSDNETADPQP
ncbi:S9 family peptidase [Granulicella tundricola]|uniref:Peptidase S9B dipeptidylpeptidase IV domain protein n=1 Tax=Granulicella tundricola (strain ATCC BAA-1859 / DSM 23138 / MP5ACTX9) TaxID=1198114 RepID=E8WW64_GRATM|nr:DPP IV N-terminal domain-containing protein [Granulicella tundricola]ADW67370.1 peptidase S9B dipeptidylpeptidase IV domain protein [Granulicella tundricola MP5ACTX9]